MKHQAKKLYDHIKIYVEANIDSLTWQECAAYAKKQDALYNIFTE